MSEYKFDAMRWCRTMAKAHWQRNEHDISSTFRTVAEEIDRLRAENETLRNEARVYRAQCDMRDEWRDKIEGELAALRDVARPVVAMRKRLEDDTRKGDFDDEWIDALDALAALVGEG